MGEGGCRLALGTSVAVPLLQNQDDEDYNNDYDYNDHDDEEDDLSLAKEKLGLVSWLLLLLWLLAEPLSLDGEAKGAEIQLPAGKIR